MSLQLHASGEHVLEFQRALNRRALHLRLPLVLEDGFLGRQTLDAYHAIAWKLGLTDDRAAGKQIPDTVREGIEEPQRRTDAEKQRGRIRQRHIGPDLTAEHMMRGIALLQLLGDWDAWVSRRVESFAFAEHDETVLVRKRSTDFTLPSNVLWDDAQAADGPVPVPLTFASKWRLPSFDVRDEAGNALPLMTRRDHGPLSAAALVAMAYRIVADDLPTRTSHVIPLALEEDLRAIVNEEEDTALGVFRRLGSPPAGGETVVPGQKSELEWRRKLIASAPFMELALEFAHGFLVMVLCPPPHDCRRIVKISYEWPVRENRRSRPRRSIWGPIERARNATSAVPWRLGNDGKPPTAYGRLIL